MHIGGSRTARDHDQWSGIFRGSSAWPVGGQADEIKGDLGRYRAAPAT